MHQTPRAMFNFCFVFILSKVVFAAEDDGKAPLVTLNDGHKMPMFALGTWLGNNSQGRILPAGHEVEQAVLWAFEAGYRHIDTAWAYKVEDQVGRAVKTVVEAYEEKHQTTTTPKACNAGCYLDRLKKKITRTNNIVPAVPRDKIFITTKLWNDAHARSQVVPALRASLAQLQMSYVDLYLIHWPLGQFVNQSYDFTHYLDTWHGMMDAQDLGLARSIGVSNFNQVMLENIRAHQLAKPAVLQIEWNLNLQQPQLLSYCRQHNIAVMGYTPFGSLIRSRLAAVAPPPRINDPTLKSIAAKHGKSVTQIVLRYAVENGVTPIPKSLNSTRIFENIDIFDFQLDSEDKMALRAFDRGYRTVPQLKWKDHPFYPFEKQPDIPSTSTTSTSTTEAIDTLNTTGQAIAGLVTKNNSSRVHFIDITNK